MRSINNQLKVPKEREKLRTITKLPTHIEGLDAILGGGLPGGRSTLICGGPGCGKTVFAMEFLVRAALAGEPGVFLAFEETPEELMRNMASLGMDVQALVDQKKLVLHYVQAERAEIQETGEYDLEALFVRIDHALKTVGAKRIALDTIEALFAAFPNRYIIRSEFRRLVRWLKDRGVTAVITGERGSGSLTRDGMEEYVSDCVILLDNRIAGQIATRRLRVIKYRGSQLNTDEYPFLIDDKGIVVMPITSVGLDYAVSSDRVSTGVEGLDDMLDRRGFYRGSTVLISGTAGTGKTSFAVKFVDGRCSAGERCLYFAFEESSSQIIRNMRSIGIDLERWMRKGLLKMVPIRPTAYGLESHLTTMHRQLLEFKPENVILDPMTNLVTVSTPVDVKSVLVRLIDQLKLNQITTVFTSLISSISEANVGVSSLIDTWIALEEVQSGGERNRGLYLVKSRGMGHSNQVREFRFGRQGIELLTPYPVVTGGVLTGTARVQHEASERARSLLELQDRERQRERLERRRRVVEAQVAALEAELAAEEQEMRQFELQGCTRMQLAEVDRKLMVESRQLRGASEGDGRIPRSRKPAKLRKGGPR